MFSKGCGKSNKTFLVKRLLSEISPSIKLITIGIDTPAMLQATQVQTDLTGTSFVLKAPTGEWLVKTALLGQFNVYNCLTALGICYAQGYDLNTVVPALSTFSHLHLHCIILLHKS